MKHVPVMLNNVMQVLGDIRNRHIIDATFGAGGYSRAFLKAGAKVTAFDRDPNVISDVKALKSEFNGNFTFIPAPFSKMADLADVYDAVVFDLGISSMQIDEAGRGFSFRGDGPLDMRMSGCGETAAELIKRVTVTELSQILKNFGDLSHANSIAKILKEKLPNTTLDLRGLIPNPKDIAPVFQALRIAVNDELTEIQRALNVVPDLLVPGGMCICVTFHSLEDRLVKNTFNQWTKTPGDPHLPAIMVAPFSVVCTQKPDNTEIEENPRARSAHLRAVQKQKC